MAGTTMTKKPRKKSEKELARNKEYQKEYWAENREELLKRRKERYHTDPDYRRKVRLRSKRTHWLEEGGTARDFPPFGDLNTLEPKTTLPVTVTHPDDVRVGQTLTVPVFSTSDVAELLGRDPNVLRLWWKRKQVPEPFYRGENLPRGVIKGRNPRLFTADEVDAINRVKENLNLPSRQSNAALFAEALTAEYAKMDKGLYIKRADDPEPSYHWTEA